MSRRYRGGDGTHAHQAALTVRRCERPTCSEVGTVAFAFDVVQRTVSFGPLGPDGPAAGVLCRRHADAMVLPRGWWLDDRRVGEALFAPPDPVAGLVAGPVESEAEAEPRAEAAGPQPVAPHEAPAPARRRRRKAGAILPAVPEDDEVRDEVDEAGVAPSDEAPEAPDERAAPGWRPVFDADDDLGGLLDASSPLLARAFGQRSAEPAAKRPRRRRTG